MIKIGLLAAGMLLARPTWGQECKGVDMAGPLSLGEDSPLLTCTTKDSRGDLARLATKIAEHQREQAYVAFSLLLDNLGCPMKLFDLLVRLPKDVPELHLATLGKCYAPNIDVAEAVPPDSFLHKFIAEIHQAQGEDQVVMLRPEHHQGLLPILPHMLWWQVEDLRAHPRWAPSTIAMMTNDPLANGRLLRMIRSVAQGNTDQLTVLAAVAGSLFENETHLLAALEAALLCQGSAAHLDKVVEILGVDRLRRVLSELHERSYISTDAYNRVAAIVDPSRMSVAVVASDPAVGTIVIPGPPPPPPPPPPVLGRGTAKGPATKWAKVEAAPSPAAAKSLLSETVAGIAVGAGLSTSALLERLTHLKKTGGLDGKLPVVHRDASKRIMQEFGDLGVEKMAGRQVDTKHQAPETGKNESSERSEDEWNYLGQTGNR